MTDKLTENQVIAMNTGTWLVRRLTEYRAKLGLPVLDRSTPYLVALPSDIDGVLMTGSDGSILLANRNAGRVLDLPLPDGAPVGTLRVGAPADRSERRQYVRRVDCYDTADLFREACAEMLAKGLISQDTFDSNRGSRERSLLPFAA